MRARYYIERYHLKTIFPYSFCQKIVVERRRIISQLKRYPIIFPRSLHTRVLVLLRLPSFNNSCTAKERRIFLPVLIYLLNVCTTATSFIVWSQNYERYDRNEFATFSLNIKTGQIPMFHFVRSFLIGHRRAFTFNQCNSLQIHIMIM